MDWAALMRVGLQGLGLEPAAFWRLTPVELATMVGTATRAAPMTRAGLDALMRSYPDTRKEGDRDGLR